MLNQQIRMNLLDRGVSWSPINWPYRRSSQFDISRLLSCRIASKRSTLNTRPVRRLLFIILLLCVPLQMAWAMSGSYCAHEAGSAAKHFGHHEHQHRTAADKSADKSKPGAKHKDCNACQAFMAAVTIPESILHLSDLVSVLSHPPHLHPPLVFYPGLERPNWTAAV